VHSDPASAAASAEEVSDEVNEEALTAVMRVVPLGAGVLAGTAVALLVIGYLLIYLLIFVPRCIAVPHGRRVTLRFASPDVIHGLLVTGTNVNTMVVPGFVSQVFTEFTRTGDLLMPCHEYCGLGHSEMWATVQVVPESEMRPDAQGRLACAQR
jgi:Cytochrome C oxidase subunit II, periplasmic domain